MFDDINYNVHQTFGISHSVIKVQFTNFSIQCFRLIFLANCYSAIWISMINFFLTFMIENMWTKLYYTPSFNKAKKKKKSLRKSFDFHAIFATIICCSWNPPCNWHDSLYNLIQQFVFLNNWDMRLENQ